MSKILSENQRIVSPAVQLKTDKKIILLSPRTYNSIILRKQIQLLGLPRDDYEHYHYGFIDNMGNFLNKDEAYDCALITRQLKQKSFCELLCPYMLPMRTVHCAAVQFSLQEEKFVILSPRHFDLLSHTLFERLKQNTGKIIKNSNSIQGFWTKYGFQKRDVSWDLAEKANEIICEVSSPGILFSENLY